MTFNQIRDENGVGYARMDMISCGLLLYHNGQWRAEQLFSYLQAILKRQTEHCDGSPVELLAVGAA